MLTGRFGGVAPVMMRAMILTLWPREGAAPRYRLLNYLPYWKAAGIEADVCPLVDSHVFSFLYEEGLARQKAWAYLKATLKRVRDLLRVQKYDVVIIHGGVYHFGPAIFEFVIRRLLRKPIIYDIDDAVFLPIRTEANRLVGLLKLNPTRVRQIVQLSDHIVAGNPYLQEYCLRYNQNVTVIPTVVNLSEYHFDSARYDRSDSRIVIGWIGSSGTSAHLSMLRHVLSDLLSCFPNLEVVLIGPGSDRFGHSRIRVVEWNLQTEMAELARFDIGINPLYSDVFSRGKCGLKTLQYMAMGIPAVSSPVGVNTEIITDGLNGFLPNSESEWCARLEDLILNRALRRKVGIAGREVVERNYHCGLTYQRWVRIIQQVVVSNQDA